MGKILEPLTHKLSTISELTLYNENVHRFSNLRDHLLNEFTRQIQNTRHENEGKPSSTYLTGFLLRGGGSFERLLPPPPQFLSEKSRNISITIEICITADFAPLTEKIPARTPVPAGTYIGWSVRCESRLFR